MLLALIGLVAAWVAGRGSLSQKATVQVPEEPLRHVYVQSKVGSADKCLVTDRAGATVRRSEPELGKMRWKCRWSDGPDGPWLSALTGKEPSFLFVPEAAVVDPAQPFVYEAVRGLEDLPLPRVRWVHLFFDRSYRGLFLQVRLPDKKLTTRLELGRGEFLSVDGSTASCWSRKLKPTCLLWNSAFIAEAIFPDPAWSPGSTLLNDLLSDTQLTTRTFLLTELPKGKSHLWPWLLPVDLSRQLQGSGPEASPYRDQRYLRWSRSSMPALSGADVAELDLPTAEWIRAALVEAVGTEGEAAMIRRLEASPTLAWLMRSELSAKVGES